MTLMLLCPRRSPRPPPPPPPHQGVQVRALSGQQDERGIGSVVEGPRHVEPRQLLVGEHLQVGVVELHQLHHHGGSDLRGGEAVGKARGRCWEHVLEDANGWW